MAAGAIPRTCADAPALARALTEALAAPSLTADAANDRWVA